MLTIKMPSVVKNSIQSFFIPVSLVITISLWCFTAFAQAPAISYQTPNTFVINKAILPLVPANTGGAVPATIYGQVSTFAGANGQYGTTTGVVQNAAGDTFIADYDYNVIHEVSATGVLSNFAGSGAVGSANGQGTAATFFEPDGLTIDAAGNLYVADLSNNLIRKITPAGLVSTFAGSGNFAANNGVGTAASFSDPRGLGIDQAGNVYVADQTNNLIRKITPAGVVTTVAGGSSSYGFTNGTGTQASFNTPTGVGVDASGNLLIADEFNNAIRKITSAGVVTTYAIGFNAPREVRADGTGNLYVTEQYGNSVKRVSVSGIVTTIAGTGAIGAINGNGNVATFNNPIGLLLDGKGNLYVGDSQNHLVRKIIITGYTIDKSLPPGLIFDPTTGNISGTPTTVYPATDYTVTAYNAGGSNSTIVNIAVENFGFAAIPGKTVCDADFDPGAYGNNIIYTSSNTGVAVIISGKIHITGAGTSVIAGTSGSVTLSQTLTVAPALTPVVAIASSAINPVCGGTNVTFTATAVNGGTNPTYQWLLNGVNAGTNSNQFSSSAFTYTDVIVCTITNNDKTCLTTTMATSAALGSNIIPPASPSVSIAISANYVYPGTTLTFTATPVNAGAAPSYQWLVNGINAGANSPVFTASNFIRGDEVSCVLTIHSGCTPLVTSNKITVIIIPAPTVTITNTFTPNGDGVNDVWNIPDLITYPNCLVSVFNRYGALLYQSKGYSKAWDGSYKGFSLPTSTYYYVIDLGNKTNTLSGPITIIR